MEIKLITTNVTTSGGGVKFKFLGNVEIKPKPKLILFGTTRDPYEKPTFRFNNVQTSVTLNDENYFELYRDTNEQITKFVLMYPTSYILTTLNFSNFDTSQFTDMHSMFHDCYDLASLDISPFNTSQVTDMSQMFSGCTSLASLNLSNFNTSKVTYMGYMFNGCSGLTSLDLSKWNTSQVTNISEMFNWCEKLTSLDLSNWNISKVRDIGSMFKGCASLRTIKINNEASANKLIAQIQTDLSKTATWNTETKKITIPE